MKVIKNAFIVTMDPDRNVYRNGHIWIDALQKRNLMAHTYDEKTADKAEELIKTDYFKVLNDLILELTDKL